jgi:hypothetical protein
MGWVLGSAIAFVAVTALVIALARPVTARWEKARATPRHSARRSRRRRV